jgi:hypothetical protein
MRPPCAPASPARPTPPSGRAFARTAAGCRRRHRPLEPRQALRGLDRPGEPERRPSTRGTRRARVSDFAAGRAHERRRTSELVVSQQRPRVPSFSVDEGCRRDNRGKSTERPTIGPHRARAAAPAPRAARAPPADKFHGVLAPKAWGREVVTRAEPEANAIDAGPPARPPEEASGSCGGVTVGVQVPLRTFLAE